MQYDMENWEFTVNIHCLSFADESSAITCKLFETDSSKHEVIIISNSPGRNIYKVSIVYVSTHYLSNWLHVLHIICLQAK